MIAEMIPESFSHIVLVTGSRSWNDEKSMRETFNDAWRDWGPKNVTRPVLSHARPSSTSAGSPDVGSETRSSSCRIRRGTSRTAPSTAGLAREPRGSRQQP
jgi:hypothetical protein